jgi:hypothetical protein
VRARDTRGRPGDQGAIGDGGHQPDLAVQYFGRGCCRTGQAGPRSARRRGIRVRFPDRGAGEGTGHRSFVYTGSARPGGFVPFDAEDKALPGKRSKIAVTDKVSLAIRYQGQPAAWACAFFRYRR